MGTQLEIAQNPQDEQALLAWLSQKAELLALPRFPTQPNPQPMSLDRQLEGNLIFFLAAYRSTVLDNIRPVKGREGFWHLFPFHGLCFQWNRTETRDQNRFVAGRFYFSPENGLHKQSSDLLRKLVRTLFNHLHKTYPLRSIHKPPVLVGPGLAAAIEANEARMYYANGNTPMELVPNEKAKT